MHSLAQRVLSHIRRQELLKAGDRVGVAVSGGIDSVALLRLLLEVRGELGIVLSVVHFNHRLRGAESEADQEFVAGLAPAYDLEFYCDGDDVARHAADERVSVETAARELRYGFFHHLLCADDGPQGLKPQSIEAPNGTTEVLPLPFSLNRIADRSPEDDASPKSKTVVSEATSNKVILNKIMTGHTLDDQAETVLMHVIRGSGGRGLGGIHSRILVEGDDGEASGEIVRPLLTVRHRELGQYLNDIGQAWREDFSNTDERFTRNRVRKLLVPLIEKEFNPSVAENLAELADIARGEEDYWENEVAGWLGTTVHWAAPEWARDDGGEVGLVQIAGLGTTAGWTPGTAATDVTLQSRIDDAPWLVANASVSRMWFLGEPVAVQRRLVKAIGEHAGIPLEFKHVEEILRVATGDGLHSAVSLPLGWKLVLDREQLIFVTPDLRDPLPAGDYEYELAIPGRIVVYEAGSVLEVRKIEASAGVSDTTSAGYNPEQLLDAESLRTPLKVRNWRPGDRFWPAHTKSPKKIKELLQERHVSQAERFSWPVIVIGGGSGDGSGGEIVWMRGWRVPAKIQAKPGRDAIAIMETRVAGGQRK